MDETRRIYLVKKGINIKKLPLDGTYDSFIEIPFDVILDLDVVFIEKGVYRALDTLFGPGDCDYINSEKCVIFIKELNKLVFDASLKKHIDAMIKFAEKAIEKDTGLFFDF